MFMYYLSVCLREFSRLLGCALGIIFLFYFGIFFFTVFCSLSLFLFLFFCSFIFFVFIFQQPHRTVEYFQLVDYYRVENKRKEITICTVLSRMLSYFFQMSTFPHDYMDRIMNNLCKFNNFHFQYISI